MSFGIFAHPSRRNFGHSTLTFHKFVFHTATMAMQAGGLAPAFIQKMFRESNSSIILERMLLIISQLARMARVATRTGSAPGAMSDNYQLIHESEFYGPVRKLMQHKDAPVRMRVCNLVGVPHQVFVSLGRR